MASGTGGRRRAAPAAARALARATASLRCRAPLADRHGVVSDAPAVACTRAFAATATAVAATVATAAAAAVTPTSAAVATAAAGGQAIRSALLPTHSAEPAAAPWLGASRGLPRTAATVVGGGGARDVAQLLGEQRGGPVAALAAAPRGCFRCRRKRVAAAHRVSVEQSVVADG